MSNLKGFVWARIGIKARRLFTRYFLALVDEANLTRPAARVGIAQSSCSAQVRDLKREVGMPLFRRVPQGATLTSAGSAFLAGIRVMPGAVQDAVESARRAGRDETGELAVGFTAAAAFNHVVPDAIRAFRGAYPGVLLRLEEANTSTLAAGLRRGTLNACFLRQDRDLSGFRLARLVDKPLLLALSVRHPAAARDAVPLAALSDDALLMFPRAAGPVPYDEIVGAFSRCGVEPRLGQTAPQIASIINLVVASLGVTLVPACMAQIAVSGVTYRPIEGEVSTTRILLASCRDETRPTVRNFIACARPQGCGPAIRGGDDIAGATALARIRRGVGRQAGACPSRRRAMGRNAATIVATGTKPPQATMIVPRPIRIL